MLRTQKQNNILKIVIAMVLITVAIVVYFIFSPQESGFFPQCTFHRLTGYDCPGCGSQRALHHLLHLHLAQALSYNPLTILAIPYLMGGIYMEYLGGKTKHPQVRKHIYGKRAAIIIFILILAFWIGRNLV